MLQEMLSTGWLQEHYVRNVACIAQYWFAPGTLGKNCFMYCSLLVGSRSVEYELLHTLVSTGWLHEAYLETLQAHFSLK
jgi:hypothetical protein